MKYVILLAYIAFEYADADALYSHSRDCVRSAYFLKFNLVFICISKMVK